MKSSWLDPIVQQDVKEFLLEGGEHFPPTVVLGASGMIGSYVTTFIALVNQELGSKNATIAVSRNSSEYLRRLSQFNLIETCSFKDLDLKSLKLLDPLIVHAASPASITAHLASSKDLIKTNIEMTIRICELLSETNGHLTYLSSGEVYGPQARIPTKENDYSSFDHLSLRGAYPEVKRTGELIAKTWSEQDSFSASALRVYHTFGPGMRLDDNRIFSFSISAIIKNEDIVLNSAGNATRSFLYTKDLVTAIQSTRKIQGFEVYNVASDNEMSILEFAQKVASFSDVSKVKILKEEDTLRSPIMRGAADTQKLKNTGWKAGVSINEAISRTVESLYWRARNKISE